MGMILYVAGLVCAIWCILDIFKKPIGLVGKIITAVLVWCTSWVGVIAYYFWIRHNITTWFK